MQYEAEEKRKVTGFPTAKELRQAKEVAEARLKREEEEEEHIGLVRLKKNSVKESLPIWLNRNERQRMCRQLVLPKYFIFYLISLENTQTFSLAKSSRN